MVIDKEGEISPVFKFTCQGKSDMSSKLLLKHGHVNKSVKEACPMSKEIRIAFHQYPLAFEIDEENGGTMVEMPLWVSFVYGAHDNEVLSSFFTTHNLTPTWIDNNDTWGSWDNETGVWTGGRMALVSRTMFCAF